MYQKDNSFLLKSSASSLNNNLSLFTDSTGKTHVAVIHKSTVNIVTLNNEIGTNIRQVSCKGIAGSSSNCMTVILQAEWVTLGKRTVFVLGSQRGIQIFEWDGTVLYHWHGFSNQDPDNPTELFARGIAGCGEGLLCVGTHDGSILVFHVPPEGDNITFLETLQGHSEAITDLFGQGSLLASADDNGYICLWEGTNSLKKKQSFQGYSHSCTSIRLWKNFIVAAYGNGHIRVFDYKIGYLIAEVAAHARWITAIDIAQETGLVLSVSEDTFLRVWQLAPDSLPIISHKFSHIVADTQLCGGCFLNSSGSSFCTTGYDLHEVLCYRM